MASLRVSGGELRGRRLAGPRRGSELRPTTERVREAVFSMLGEIADVRVLDLFCGTGALAIEALSRGAAGATLVDSQTGLAHKNIGALGLGGRARLVRDDAVAFLGRAPEAGFDLVLCDPPYGLADRLSDELDPLLRRALAPGGRVMVETSPQGPLRLSLPLLRERRYGDTLVRIHGAPPEGGEA